MVPEIGSATDKIFCHFGLFLLSYPPNNPQNQNFEKMNKIPGDIIILHMRTINYNHIMHGSCDMVRNRQNFSSFWTIFCPFKLANNPENLNFEKMKKNPQYIIILHKCTKYHDHMLYCSLDMTCVRCNRYFSFWAIFDPFTPLTAQKIKIFLKMKKNT